MAAGCSRGSLNRTEKVLNEIDDYANRHFLHIVNREKGLLIEGLVRRRRPAVALEIGTLVGYSAIRIARNLPMNGKLISIEINKTKANEAVQNIAAAGLANEVRVIVGDALNIISGLGGQVDFVFFDVSDYMKCLSRLEENGCIRKGCVIVANNVRWFYQQLQPYLDYVRNSGMYKSIYYDFGFDGMEVSVKR